jgi:hypothetical protein
MRGTHCLRRIGYFGRQRQLKHRSSHQLNVWFHQNTSQKKGGNLPQGGSADVQGILQWPSPVQEDPMAQHPDEFVQAEVPLEKTL